MADIIKKYSPPFFIVALPALMFYWMFPFFSDISPGRDFFVTIWVQLSALFSIRTGSFPLYSPMVTGGLSGSLFTFCGLIYLPLSWFASILPGYWSGNAADWNLLLHFITIAGAHLALYTFLRRIGTSPLLALFLSIITVYPQRLLISICYGMAIESWTGHLFLCSAIGLYYIKPTKIKGPICIIIATYWVINSGHPEEIVFALIGSALFGLLLPYFLATLSPKWATDMKKNIRFWSHILFYAILGLLLSSALLCPFYFDVAKNIAVGHQGYKWSCYQQTSLPELINAFSSQLNVGSQRSFSATAIYLIVLLIPALAIVKIKIPKVIWIILGVMLLVFIYALGDLTPLHYMAWKYIPFFSSIRIPSRSFSILPILFLLLLLWFFNTETKESFSFFNRQFQVSTQNLLCLVVLIFFPIFFLLANLVNHIWELPVLVKVNLKLLPLWAEPTILLTNIFLLAFVTAYSLPRRFKEQFLLCLCVITTFHLMVLFKYTSPPITTSKTTFTPPTFSEIKEYHHQTMYCIGDKRYLDWDNPFVSASVLGHMKNNVLEPVPARIYQNVRYAENRQGVYKILSQGRRFDEAIIEDVPPAEKRIESNKYNRKMESASVELTYNSYNRIVFQSTSGTAAFFVLSYPFSRHWRAWVDNKAAKIYRANGIAQAVRIPGGGSTVEFRYWSDAACWGMAISCLTLGMIVFALSIIGIKKPIKYFFAPGGFVIGLFLFGLWYSSLYSGDNLQTEYKWDSASSAATMPANIAYGKPTTISSTVSTRFIQGYEYLHDGKRVVDGDSSFTSCCLTEYQFMPWWKVDLTREENISSIKISARLVGKEFNKMIFVAADNIFVDKIHGKPVLNKRPVLFNNLPLIIGISKDNMNWDYALVHAIDKDTPLHLTFDAPRTFRYLKITASGNCRLCLNEVEIYSYQMKERSSEGQEEEQRPH